MAIKVQINNQVHSKSSNYMHISVISLLNQPNFVFPISDSTWSRSTIVITLLHTCSNFMVYDERRNEIRFATICELFFDNKPFFMKYKFHRRNLME
ncbi:hypothetical protein BLOT_003712 [Blomia tropicalis]|nr:hypothetical protein BLOT_003712 [Blomia tropicalis]